MELVSSQLVTYGFNSRRLKGLQGMALSQQTLVYAKSSCSMTTTYIKVSKYSSPHMTNNTNSWTKTIQKRSNLHKKTSSIWHWKHHNYTVQCNDHWNV